MAITIALAGNPNCGKTTLFNALTGSNQYVGNWPGVTVEKKEGRLKGNKDVIIADLPGIYSLSPYTLEEVVARNYLINSRPDAIINIIDGTNLERNLYLSTQVLELGIPVLMVINMMDLVRKNGDEINIRKLSENLGCPVMEISALKSEGIDEAAKKAIELAKAGKAPERVHKFEDSVEKVLASIEGKLSGSAIPDVQKRFFAIKLLERDNKITEQLTAVPDVEEEIKSIEKEMDDDTESIITNERYNYISSIIGNCYKKKVSADGMTLSDRIDRIVTNRILALPIFVVIMYLVYYIAMSTVGAAATDWTNDNLFGDGFFLGSDGGYADASDEYAGAMEVLNGFISYEAEQGVDTAEVEAALDTEAEDYDPAAAAAAVDAFVAEIDPSEVAIYTVDDEETAATEEVEAGYEDLTGAVESLNGLSYTEPDPKEYGTFIDSIPNMVSGVLESMNCADWLSGLIVDGIVAGVGAVLGFVPQMLVLFFLLSILEYCGYMARIAFIMDRIFRKFGLSGKSFIPILVGTGCGIPGIMASRTIENERDRRMTIMTTTFIPCGAKTPFIAMVAGAIFGGAAWVATSAYFLGMGAIIVSGIMLKKTKMFAGDPAPFVMELPAYHMPTIGAVLRSTWERGWSFIKKAGTIITLSTILVWFLSYFGWVDGAFGMLSEDQLDSSILASVGHAVAWIFAPLGFANWQATVASITGLVAKENIVGTMSILYSGGEGTVYQTMSAAFTPVSGYAFLTFNLLCAPCFAAMGAIKREMNNTKWFWFAIGYQCVFAWCIGLIVYQIGTLVTGGGFGIFTIVAFAFIAGIIYMLVRPYKEATTLNYSAKKVSAK